VADAAPAPDDTLESDAPAVTVTDETAAAVTDSADAVDARSAAAAATAAASESESEQAAVRVAVVNAHAEAASDQVSFRSLANSNASTAIEKLRVPTKKRPQWACACGHCTLLLLQS
jgi:hypothetical protein